MATKSTLELYSSLILPRLADGPKTREQLDVPQYACERLQAHGLVKPSTYRIGDVAFPVWFLKEDWELLKEAGMTRPTLTTRMGCHDHDLFNGMPEDGAL
jgi:hypothetical protein